MLPSEPERRRRTSAVRRASSRGSARARRRKPPAGRSIPTARASRAPSCDARGAEIRPPRSRGSARLLQIPANLALRVVAGVDVHVALAVLDVLHELVERHGALVQVL